MKFFLSILFSALFTGCWYVPDDPIIIEESKYEPIIMSRTDFENAISISNSKEVLEAGKIYVIDDYLYLNDKNKGFHIINNETPEQPLKERFLEIPGATDVAIRNNTLYINQATDLIVLTLNINSGEVQVKKRLKDVFPQMMSPDGFLANVKADKVIVDWKLK
jgi:hypothetical protein